MLQRGNESVAPSVDGLDESWRVGCVSKRAPDFAHADLQHGVTDVNVWPDIVEELAFGDQPAGVPDQVVQDVEGFRGQRNRVCAAPHPLIEWVEAKGPEPERFPLHAANTFLHRSVSYHNFTNRL